MKSLYTVALLNAAAYAACSEQTKKKYLGFVAAFDKQIQDVEDLEKHLEAYDKCRKEIDWLNQHATGVTFGENWTCDLLEDEKARIMGIRLPEDADAVKARSVQDTSSSGGLRNGPADNINWADKGKIWGVKNQG